MLGCYCCIMSCVSSGSGGPPALKEKTTKSYSRQLESQGKSCSESHWVSWKNRSLSRAHGLHRLCGKGENCRIAAIFKELQMPPQSKCLSNLRTIINTIKHSRNTSGLRSHAEGLEWENTSHTCSSWVIQCQDSVSSLSLWFIQFLSLVVFV